MRVSLYVSTTVLLIAYLFHFIFKELKSTIYILTNDRIIKKTPLKTVLVHLSDVASFRYKRIPFCNGHGYIKTSSKTLRIPFIIENLSELVLLLKEHFETHNKHSVFDNKEIEEMTFRAVVSDFFVNHTWSMLHILFYITCFTAFFSFITARLFWKLPLMFSISWTMLGLLFPISGYLILHVLISRNIMLHLKKFPLSVPVINLNQMYRVTLFLTGMAYFICGILFKSVVIYLLY